MPGAAYFTDFMFVCYWKSPFLLEPVLMDCRLVDFFVFWFFLNISFFGRKYVESYRSLAAPFVIVRVPLAQKCKPS